jgi:hypothetical protein
MLPDPKLAKLLACGQFRGILASWQTIPVRREFETIRQNLPPMPKNAL